MMDSHVLGFGIVYYSHNMNTKPQYLPTRSLWLLLTIAMLFYCLDYYYRIIPSLVLPELMTQYNSGPQAIGGFYSAFYFGYLLMQIPCGYFLDRFSLRMILSTMILVCTVLFGLFIWTNTVWLGLVLRFLIGAFSAFSFISLLYIARYYFPPRYFSVITGVAIGAGTTVAAGAQSFSAFLISKDNWHWVLSFQASWGIVLATLLFFVYPKKLHRRFKREVLPVRELKREFLILIKNKVVVFNAVIGALFYLPTSIFAAAWGITFLKASYHISATSASFGIVLLFAGWAVGSPIIGYFAERYRNFSMVMTFCAFALVLVTFSLLNFANVIGSGVFVLLFLFGLLSSSQVLMWKIFSIICPQNLTGVGAAFTNMVVILGGTIFHLLVGYLISMDQADQMNLLRGLSILPIVFLCAALLSLALWKKT